jgi:hypothetical protein
MANYIMTKNPDDIWIHSSERYAFGKPGTLYLVENADMNGYIKFGSTTIPLERRLQKYRDRAHNHPLADFDPILLWSTSVSDVGRANVSIKYILDNTCRDKRGNDWYKMTYTQFKRNKAIKRVLEEYTDISGNV